MFENSKAAWSALACIAIIGWYGTRADAPMVTAQDQHAAGVWFVDQLDLDARQDPARRTYALNKCIAPYMENGKVNWVHARNCYAGRL